MAAAVILLLLLLVLGVWFLPSIIAWRRSHPRLPLIIVVNVFPTPLGALLIK
jgi:Superinfection immunity protein